MDRWLTKVIAAVTLASSLSCASPPQSPPPKNFPQVLAASRTKLASVLQRAEDNVEKMKREAQFVQTLKKDDTHYALRLRAFVNKVVHLLPFSANKSILRNNSSTQWKTKDNKILPPVKE